MTIDNQFIAFHRYGDAAYTLTVGLSDADVLEQIRWGCKPAFVISPERQAGYLTLDEQVGLRFSRERVHRGDPGLDVVQ